MFFFLLAVQRQRWIMMFTILDSYCWNHLLDPLQVTKVKHFSLMKRLVKTSKIIFQLYEIWWWFFSVIFFSFLVILIVLIILLVPKTSLRIHVFKTEPEIKPVRPPVYGPTGWIGRPDPVLRTLLQISMWWLMRCD